MGKRKSLEKSIDQVFDQKKDINEGGQSKKRKLEDISSVVVGEEEKKSTGTEKDISGESSVTNALANCGSREEISSESELHSENSINALLYSSNEWDSGNQISDTQDEYNLEEESELDRVRYADETTDCENYVYDFMVSDGSEGYVEDPNYFADSAETIYTSTSGWLSGNEYSDLSFITSATSCTIDSLDEEDNLPAGMTESDLSFITSDSDSDTSESNMEWEWELEDFTEEDPGYEGDIDSDIE